MTTPNPYDHLCWHDKRYTNRPEDIGDYGEPRQQSCMCDNCHTGKDALAMEILRLREIVTELAQAVFNDLGVGKEWLDNALNNKETK